MTILRRALKRVQDVLSRQAAVALLGPRQVGKTTPADTVAEQTGAISPAPTAPSTAR
jgi:predicted AAA+ superfamily ATPase